MEIIVICSTFVTKQLKLRKAIAILFFICLTGPVTISFIWLQYQKQIVRSEVEQKLFEENAEHLTLLRITKSEISTSLNWNNDHEFEFDGKMYDVVNAEEDGDKIIFHCWDDNKETELNQQLNELLTFEHNGDSEHNKSLNNLSQFMKTLFFYNTNGDIAFEFLDRNLPIDSNLDYYQSINFSPPVPPPEFV